jgi:hypothetical protein
MFKAIFFLLFTVAASVVADVQVSGSGGEYFDVLGRSGKIVMGLNNETNVEIRMSAVVERDSDGNAVGKTGSVKHTFNNFASQDFTFGEPEYGDWSGVDYAMVPFQSILFADTNLTVKIYLFIGEGVISDGSNSFAVGPGTFKYSYFLQNWPFCTLSENGGNTDDNTLCMKGGSEEEGSTLDFTITVTSQGLGTSTASTEANSTDIEWNDGSVLINPQEYTVEENLLTMADGFPSSETVNETTTLVFRFDRFDNGTLYYDPVMGFAGSNSIVNATDDAIITDDKITDDAITDDDINTNGTDSNGKGKGRGKKGPSKQKGRNKQRPRAKKGPMKNGAKPDDDEDNTTLTTGWVDVGDAGTAGIDHTVSKPVAVFSIGVVAFIAVLAIGVLVIRLKKSQWDHKPLPVTSGHVMPETGLDL